MKVQLKNLVCRGTRLLLSKELGKMGFDFLFFEKDEIEFTKELTTLEIKQIDKSFSEYGLESNIHQHRFPQNQSDN